MREFIRMAPEPLNIPDKCQNCPAICIIKNEADKRDTEIRRDVKTAFVDDESKHAQRQRIVKKYVSSTSEVELNESLEEKRKRLAGVLDQQEEDIESDQFDIDEVTGECEGPTRLEGTSPLGRKVVAVVCGSEAYDNISDRFFAGPGHGQTQHEQVHVERLLHPNEFDG
ncbi:hypothetical protein KC947_01080 [Candidatus Saccharibacteria bacterium]|nr:hypothetical protein [Candidatus Saccharibacteria bacterium]